MGTRGIAGIIGLSIVAVSAAVACSSPESSTKTPLVVCTAGEDGCPNEKKANVPKQGTSTSSSSGGPSTSGPTLPEDQDDSPDAKDKGKDKDGGSSSVPDAAVEAAAPLGAICTKLQDCCEQLADQGYDPATCQGIVDTKNENACSLQRKQYTDFGDCTL